jgi:carboxymethylenebutenolidase
MVSRHGWASQLALAFLLVGLGAGSVLWLQRRPPTTDHRPTTHGEWVFIHRGADSIRAYVAYPERRDKAPTMLVIHEIFGLTTWEPTVVDRLAGQGYIAAVPDLLSSRFGISPSDPDSGRKLIALLNPDSITADLAAVAAYLDALPSAKRGDQGVIGFCWGGGQSFRFATNAPKLKAAVVCYGPPPDTMAMGRINAGILGVYGESDARIDATVPGTDSTMKRLHKDYFHSTYPGTGHGFLKPNAGRMGSDGPQPDVAWSDIFNFLRDRLGH